MKPGFVPSVAIRAGSRRIAELCANRQKQCVRRVRLPTRMCTSNVQPRTKVSDPSMVRASHILVDSEEMIDAVKKQLEDGKEKFAELAKLVSTCPSKDRGGDLGWFKRSTMVEAFEEAAFSNPPGSVVKVKTEFGWHLIKVQDHGMAAKSITVDELGRRFGKNGTDDLSSAQLIDCRETSELELSSLPNFLNLPMGEYAQWADQFENGELSLEKDKETIVMCHHGVRSANFCSFLAQNGFTNVRNLIGGIDAYAKKIDSSVPQY